MRSLTFGVKDHGNNRTEIMVIQHEKAEDGTEEERWVIAAAFVVLKELVEVMREHSGDSAFMYSDSFTGALRDRADKFFKKPSK